MNNLKDLLEFYFKFASEAGNYWLIFITINTTIIGWLVVRKEKLRMRLKIFGVVAYLLFTSAIGYTLTVNAKYTDALIHDINIVAADKENFVRDSAVQTALKSAGVLTWNGELRLVYIVSVLLMVLAILTDVLMIVSKKL